MAEKKEHREKNDQTLENTDQNLEYLENISSSQPPSNTAQNVIQVLQSKQEKMKQISEWIKILSLINSIQDIRSKLPMHFVYCRLDICKTDIQKVKDKLTKIQKISVTKIQRLWKVLKKINTLQEDVDTFHTFTQMMQSTQERDSIQTDQGIVNNPEYVQNIRQTFATAYNDDMAKIILHIYQISNQFHNTQSQICNIIQKHTQDS